MNVKTQVFFDKKIAKPIAYLLNFLVRLLGKIMRINHSLDREFKTIAVCKFKGMGSILQATPMLQAIRESHPNCKIIFISSKGNQEILSKIGYLDELILVDDSTFLRFIKTNILSLFKLQKRKIDVIIDLEIYSEYSTLFTLFTLSKNRIGFYLKSSSFRLGIYTHMMFFNSKASISKVYLQIAGILNCNTQDCELINLKSTLEVSERKYIIINPNASDLRIERRWSQENYQVLIEHILKNHPDLEIKLIGSPAEFEYTNELFLKFNNSRMENTAGKTTITQLIDLISNATMMISNDTGPMHLAFSTQTTIICLFGPCSPEQYGISDFAHILYKKVYCSPCVHDFEIPPCKGNNTCMQLIENKEVIDLFDKLIENPKIVPEKIKDNFIYENKENILGYLDRI